MSSLPPVQWMSDVEAKLAQLIAQNKSQPNPLELVEAVGVRIAREGQTLREDFTGKFAASFLLATETITKRVVDTEARQTKIEEGQETLARQLQTHKLEVQKMLDEADEKQRKLLKRFLGALQQQNEKNATILEAQQTTLKECTAAAEKTARAAALCTTFATDYQTVSQQAGTTLQRVSTETQGELSKYLVEIKKELGKAVEPVIKRMRQLTDEQAARRLKFAMIGLVLGIAISSGVAWLTQPSALTLFQAQHWRNWQSDNFTQEQADRINKVFNEIQAEQRAAEEKKNK